MSILDKGEGHILLFLHDPVSNPEIWDLQIDELSASYRVIVPDLNSPAFKISNMDVLAKYISSYIKNLGKYSIISLGSSSKLAYLMSVIDPISISSLIMISPDFEKNSMLSGEIVNDNLYALFNSYKINNFIRTYHPKIIITSNIDQQSTSLYEIAEQIGAHYELMNSAPGDRLNVVYQKKINNTIKSFIKNKVRIIAEEIFA